MRRYCGRGVEAEDLYQLGCLGFLKAVRGFDEAFGTEFSTYAVPKISGEIRRFLRDDGTIKVGRTLKQRAAQIAVVRERLRGAFGREPALSELAAETGLSAEEIAAAELSAAAPESLQQETAEGLTLESILRAEDGEETMLRTLALRQAKKNARSLRFAISEPIRSRSVPQWCIYHRCRFPGWKNGRSNSCAP